ncbi:MAG: hypothetical protein LQ345_003750 [Seirophora villosa]|nr:MAG: hypothetical protein LQ345_003750 [Seirophora villosa]
MVQFPLAGLTIAVTGDFGPRRSHDTLRRWVEKNGGQWATKVSKDVTHLISTKEDYRSKAPMVKMALKLKLLNIMTFDWLEGKSRLTPPLDAIGMKPNSANAADSLMKRFRLAPRGDYLVAHAIKDAKKVKKARKQTKKETIKKGVDSFKKECQDIQSQLFSDRYHVYRDSTSFAYDISLVRVNLQQNHSERYALRLCTTHDAPHSYAALLTYHARAATVGKSVLAPIGSDWATAFAAFKDAFRAKTKVEWDDRFSAAAAAAAAGKSRAGEEVFVYAVPKEGEPRGEVREDFEVRG